MGRYTHLTGRTSSGTAAAPKPAMAAPASVPTIASGPAVVYFDINPANSGRDHISGAYDFGCRLRQAGIGFRREGGRLAVTTGIGLSPAAQKQLAASAGALASFERFMLTTTEIRDSAERMRTEGTRWLTEHRRDQSSDDDDAQ